MAETEEELKQTIQDVMNKYSNVTKWGFTLGYVDKNYSFGLASGPKTYKYLPMQVEGDMEPMDRMGLGSGTKGYTAAAIMRLVDQEKLKLEDLAY
jgi:CubicO group peptidase (beta-lactamase class C family)